MVLLIQVVIYTETEVKGRREGWNVSREFGLWTKFLCARQVEDDLGNWAIKVN